MQYILFICNRYYLYAINIIHMQYILFICNISMNRAEEMTHINSCNSPFRSFQVQFLSPTMPIYLNVSHVYR